MKPTTLDDLLSLWEVQKETGKPLSPEQLCLECPELLEEFRWHVQALEEFDSHFGIVTDSRAAATPGFPSDDSAVPQSVVRMSSEFVVEKLHASGGLGSVYLAHDPILNRRVALKFPRQIHQSSAARARFEREAHITSQLDHPGIVPVHAISTTEGGPSCYATRFVEGQTLRDAIREFHESAALPTSVEFRQLLQRFVTVCNIVAYAHDRRIIHRDIKPGNILLGAFGETLLIDWGLAKVLGATPEGTPPEPVLVDRRSRGSQDDITVSGQLMGTPAYASPEQIFGRTAEVDEASDVYSLGATLFTMLTGQPLFSPDEFDRHLQRLNAGIITAPRERNAAVPEPLNAICAKALAIDKADRYPSALAFAQDIERWLADETVSVLNDPVRVRIGRAVRKRPRAAAATTATILMVLIAGILGSLILGHKNRQLTSNNQLLTKAINSSELANRQTLDALRSLVDDVVISKFDEQTALSLSERQFLNSVLMQYQAYAAIQDSSLESRVIRAEGLRQSGRIHLRLSEDIPALNDLRAASMLLTELLNEKGGSPYRAVLADTLKDISQALLRIGKLDEAEASAEQGIQVCATEFTAAATESVDGRAIRASRAELLRTLGTIQTRRQKWNHAVSSFELSEQLLTDLLLQDPLNAAYQQSLSNVCRALSVTWGRNGDVARQFEYSQRTMKLQRSLAELFPDEPEYQTGLVHSININSTQLEFRGQTSAAVEEQSQGIGIALNLVNRYPLVGHHRESLGILLSRRGILQSQLDEPNLAANDLNQAVEIFRGLVRDFPESSDYRGQLLESLYSLAARKSRTSRVNEAEALLSELFAEELRMQERFPETAQLVTTRPRAMIEYARVLQRKAKTGQAFVVLTQAVLDMEDAVRRDQTEASRITLAKARIALAAALRNVQAMALARQQLEFAADLAENIAQEHPSVFELLSRLAALHGDLEEAFGALKLQEQSIHHHLKELELRHLIVDAFPDNPYYRVELVRTLVRHGRDFIPSGNFTSSEMSLAAAETALIAARRDFPNDPLIRKTQGEIDRGLGSLLFNMGRYPEALVHFDAAVKLNPGIDHVASRLRCLAEVRPGDVLEEAHRIEQGELPNGAPLKNLIFAVGVATEKTQDAEDFVSLCDVVIRLLRYMIAEDYFPQDRTIKELLTQRRFSRLRMRSGVKDFLIRLEKRNQQLSTTASSLWTSSLPENVRLTIDKLSWQDVNRLGAPGKLLHGILSVFMAKPADHEAGQPAIAVPPSR